MFRLFDPGLGGLAGIILAGGRGHCLKQLAGEALIARVVRRLGPQVEVLAIACDPPPERYAAFHLPVLVDTPTIGKGPLAGIAAGFAFAKAALARPRAIVTVPGDTPFLPPDLVRRLVGASAGGIAVARRGGIMHPTAALWPIEMASVVSASLDAGEERIGAVIRSLPHAAVDFDEVDDPFFDPESPEELAVAERRLTGA